MYYVLFIEGDVEPKLYGPYKTHKNRDKKAQKLRAENGPEDGIFWMDMTAGKPVVGAYPANFFEEKNRFNDMDADDLNACLSDLGKDWAEVTQTDPMRVDPPSEVEKQMVREYLEENWTDDLRIQK